MSNKSIQSAGAILSLFSTVKPTLGVTEIAKEMNIAKTTAHSLIKGLVAIGFLEKDQITNKYRLGLRLYTLASTMCSSLEITRFSGDIARRIAVENKLTALVGIWDSDTVLAIIECHPEVSVTTAPQIGPRGRAYCSSLGLTLLAHMPIDEQKGYLSRVELKPLTEDTVVDPEELLKEMRIAKERGWIMLHNRIVIGRAVVGTPIYDRNGKVVAALSLSGEEKRFKGEEGKAITALSLRTSDQISRYLGYLGQSE